MATITLQLVKIISDVGVRTVTGFIRPMSLFKIFTLFNKKVLFGLNGNILFYFQPHNNMKYYYNILYTKYN